NDMRHLISQLVLLSTIALHAAIARAEVTITPLPNQSGYKVTTAAYQATLDATGAMTSLIVSGEEFLAQERKLNVDGKVTEVPAVFASHHRSWTPTFLLTGPVTIEGQTLNTKGAGWELGYA